MPPEVAKPSPGAELRTFLIADIRGYTTFTRQHGDEAASAVAAKFAGIVRSVMPEFDGELLELRGDEALCVFGSARQALRAAVGIQRRLRVPTPGGDPFPLGVGVGLDAGEAVPTEGGYRGSALNTAARLCGIAVGGQVLATERLVGLTGRVDGLRMGRSRSVQLKGLDAPERVVEVEPIAPLPAPPPTASHRPSNRRRRQLLLLVVVLAGLVGAAGFLVTRGSGTATPRASVTSAPRSLAVINPGQHRVVADIPLPAEPETLISGSGQVWVGSGDQTITPVSLRSGRPGEPIGLGIDPASLTYGDGAVWIYDSLARVAEVDAQHRSLIGPLHRFWHCTANHFLHPELPSCAGAGIVLVGDELWVGTAPLPYGAIDRLNSTTFKILGVINRVDVGGALLRGLGAVWSWGNVGRNVDQVSTQTRRVTQRTDLGVAATYTGGGIALGLGYAWIADGPTGSLFAIAPGDRNYTYRYLLPHGLSGVTVTPDAVWVGVSDGRVLKINPYSGKIEETYHLGHVNPVALTYAGGQIWVALASP
jgi:class 3 adenylate cyclase